jgi:hypothetical protein
MRACPAGNGEGTCALCIVRVPNIRLRPLPREEHREMLSRLGHPHGHRETATRVARLRMTGMVVPVIGSDAPTDRLWVLPRRLEASLTRG